MIRLLTLTAALIMTAGAAAAQTAASSPIKVVWQAKPSFDLSGGKSIAGRYVHEEPDIPKGTVKTSLERRFGEQGAVGALGYLCGLAPGPNESGGVASSFDPAGTFLGGQLKIALR